MVPLGCERETPSTGAEKDAPVAQVEEPVEPPQPPDECALRIEALSAQEALPGTPELDKHRTHILGRARAVPVVFRSRPSAPPEASPRVLQFRRLLERDDDPTEAILEVLRKTRGNYPERRAVFLSDGYLYADKPLLALRLSQVLRLDHLFSKLENNVVIERGTKTLQMTRRQGRYWLPPIPDVNPKKRHHDQLASLLLFDRVRLEGEEFGERLHIDLRALQTSLGFSSASVERMTEEGIVVGLSTYGTSSHAVLSWGEDGTAGLECETAGNTRPEDLKQARDNWLLDKKLIDPVLAASHEMIFRRLPFDEPKTEEGQQDGLLRIHFRKAYRHYQSTYEFNGDNYYVFDGYGRPRLPQVCIDFITDSYDWGTGGHWPERGKRRKYVRGALNFASMGMENARSVENLAEFMMDLPEWFDVMHIPREKRIKFRHREKFFDQLATDSTKYRRGDIVFIYGLKSDGKFHYHSFMIDEKDPVTGMPTVVVANAGPPQARTWEGEMQNAPLRGIMARVRVRRDVLIAAHEQAKESPGVPLETPPLPESEEDKVERPRSRPKPRKAKAKIPVAPPVEAAPVDPSPISPAEAASPSTQPNETPGGSQPPVNEDEPVEAEKAPKGPNTDPKSEPL